jgi:pimeloyl-ACP methyl ester carboxylesterase
MVQKSNKSRFSKKLLFAGLGILVLAVIYAGVSYYLATRLVSPYPKKIIVSPSLISPHYESITMQGFENTRLRGWFFPAPSNKLIILVHGITEDRVNTGYYTVSLAKELLEKEYNVLVYDSRAHGESDGKQITYGIKESRDIVNVVTFAKTKGFEPQHIGIIANSLGALSLLMASDQLQDVGALVVDSPPVHLPVAINYALQKENHVPALFNPGIYFVMKAVYQVDVDKIQPLAHVKNAPNRTFLLLHGKLDKSIPFSQSEELLQSANPESQLVLFPNGGHIETYKNDPQKYRESVFPFLEKELQ